MNNRNLAQSSNIVFSSSTLGKDIDYFVSRVSLPGILVTSPEVFKPNTPFHTSLQIEGDSISYDPLQVTLLVDEDLQIWEEIINNVKKSTIGTLNKDEDKTRCWITIKDSNGNTRKRIVFKDAIINSVGELDYSSVQDDEEILLSLTILYTEYEIENINPPKLKK